MIRINLLPFRAARKKENIRRQVSIFFLSLIFITMVLFYYNISLNNKIHELDTRVKDIRNQIAKYNIINKEIANIKKELDILNKKIDVIIDLESNRKEPIRLLDIMTDMVIEKRMWFTRFEVKGEIISIKGIAFDNKTVADFMTSLEGSKLFASVNLTALKQQKIQGKINLKSFQITCNKAPLETAAKNKAK
jgi:type IV pilus assembly protein PilN